MTAPHGFLTTGREGERVPVNHRDALAGYAAGDSRLSLTQEAFLSHFTFPQEWRTFLRDTGSTRGYAGPCAAAWLFADIDREGNLDAALTAARTLAGVTLDTCRTLDEDSVLVFFSGAKGLHVGFPTAAAGAGAAVAGYADAARRFWQGFADAAGVVIDPSIYTPQSLLRAPNTRHPKTRLYKMRLSHRELMHLPADRIRTLAAEPRPFDVPDGDAMPPDPEAVRRWANAAAAALPTTHPGAGRSVRPSLQRATLDLVNAVRLPLRGERERRLFRAAADLTDHGVPAAAVHQLLDTPGRDCGLSPGELKHAIDGGIRYATVKGG